LSDRWVADKESFPYFSFYNTFAVTTLIRCLRCLLSSPRLAKPSYASPSFVLRCANVYSGASHNILRASFDAGRHRSLRLAMTSHASPSFSLRVVLTASIVVLTSLLLEIRLDGGDSTVWELCTYATWRLLMYATWRLLRIVKRRLSMCNRCMQCGVLIECI